MFEVKKSRKNKYQYKNREKKRKKKRRTKIEGRNSCIDTVFSK